MSLRTEQSACTRTTSRSCIGIHRVFCMCLPKCVGVCPGLASHQYHSEQKAYAHSSTRTNHAFMLLYRPCYHQVSTHVPDALSCMRRVERARWTRSTLPSRRSRRGALPTGRGGCSANTATGEIRPRGCKRGLRYRYYHRLSICLLLKQAWKFGLTDTGTRSSFFGTGDTDRHFPVI